VYKNCVEINNSKVGKKFNIHENMGNKKNHNDNNV
jgi:hypothetical protein